jgi:hypothetical protein
VGRRGSRWPTTIAAGLWLALLAVPAPAATFVVDRTDDPDPVTAMACTAAAADCSLRGAIEKANGDATPDLITFAQNGVYTLDPSRGQLTITTDLTIDGTGTDCSGSGTCIQADTVAPTTSGFRVFSIPAGVVDISDVTIRHGFGTPGGGVEVQENATVTMSDCQVSVNLAGRGGGIFNSGNLTLSDCVLVDNRALIGGGLFNDGTAEIRDDSGVAINGALFGGGIANFGQVTVNALGAGVSPGVTLRGTEVAANRALVGGASGTTPERSFSCSSSSNPRRTPARASSRSATPTCSSPRGRSSSRTARSSAAASPTRAFPPIRSTFPASGSPRPRFRPPSARRGRRSTRAASSSTARCSAAAPPTTTSPRSCCSSC